MTIYLVKVKCVYGSADTFINTHHYEFPFATPSVGDLQSLVNLIDGAYKTRLQARYSPLASLGNYEVRRVDLPNLPSLPFSATAGSWVGTAAGNSLKPDNAALTIFKAIAPFPRSSRTYHFPMTVAANTADGTVIAGVITNCQEWADDLLTLPNISGNAVEKVAVKYTGTPRSVTDENDLEFSTTSNIWYKQTSRRYGKGS